MRFFNILFGRLYTNPGEGTVLSHERIDLQNSERGRQFLFLFVRTARYTYLQPTVSVKSPEYSIYRKELFSLSGNQMGLHFHRINRMNEPATRVYYAS